MRGCWLSVGVACLSLPRPARHRERGHDPAAGGLRPARRPATGLSPPGPAGTGTGRCHSGWPRLGPTGLSGQATGAGAVAPGRDLGQELAPGRNSQRPSGPWCQWPLAANFQEPQAPGARCDRGPSSSDPPRMRCPLRSTKPHTPVPWASKYAAGFAQDRLSRLCLRAGGDRDVLGPLRLFRNWVDKVRLPTLSCSIQRTPGIQHTPGTRVAYKGHLDSFRSQRGFDQRQLATMQRPGSVL